jgi:hypothetical protein
VPGAAIVIHRELGGVIHRNHIDGAQHGIVVSEQYFHKVRILENEIANIRGHGIRSINSVAIGNRVSACDSAGIWMTTRGLDHGDSVVANRVSGVGGDGIVLEGYLSRVVEGNWVIGAGGTGIRGDQGRFEGNVVGRCGGDGIVALGEIRQNTVYANGGSGIRSLYNVVAGNLSVGNALWGFHNIENPHNPQAVLSCNNWFANGARATEGVEPGETDLAVDPLFCNLAADSVWLRFNSPLLDVAGCGRIGALGVGCDVATSTLEPGGPSRPAKTFELALSPPAPNPARPGTRIRYTLPVAMAVRLALYDVQGREVALLEQGMRNAGEYEVALDSNRDLHAGLFVVRLDADGRRLTQRMPIVR